MLKPYGSKSPVRTDARKMLSEPKPIIGTGEWTDEKNQCKNFKSVPNGTIVLVREGQRAIALCEILDGNFKDEELEAKYFHCNFRHVKVLQWAEDYCQPDKRLFSQSTFMSCKEKTAQYKYIQDWIDYINMNAKLSQITKLLKKKKNIILQGAPGTGKTYNTAALALSILDVPNVATLGRKNLMDMYREMVDNKRIFFTTFHQSMDYEDFVEGIKPEVAKDDDGKEIGITYNVQDGIFKQACAAVELGGVNEVDCLDKFIASVTGRENAKVIDTISRKSKLNVWYMPGKKTLTVRSVYSTSENGFAFLNIEKLKRQAVGEDMEYNWPQYAKAVIKAAIDEYGSKQDSPVVLIIDEINRGNISKILGELITLLEKDKRAREDNAITVTLPYSKEPFSVPSNLYIIGTMNTTDRSTGAVDYAIRRRFAFVTLKADEKILERDYPDSLPLFKAVQHFIKQHTTETLDMDDLMIGHSYFMAKDMSMAWEYEIMPLLQEYYKDGLLKQAPKEKSYVDFIANNPME